MIEVAKRGEFPRCVTVVLHMNARGKPVTLSGVDLNEVVLGKGFWVRSGG